MFSALLLRSCQEKQEISADFELRVNFEATYGQLAPDSEQSETFEALILTILSPLPFKWVSQLLC